MPRQDDSGNGGFKKQYLCIVKTAPPVLPEGMGATRQGQRLKTGPYTTKALPEN